MANYTNIQASFNPNADDVTSSSLRLPWNNVVFPGNYVAHLNAYRDQGVGSIPGVNFFRMVGVFVVPEDDNEVATGTYDLQVLSPDLRPDDKPRLDRDMVLQGQVGGGGLKVYRVGISTVNLSGNSSTITTTPNNLGPGQETLTSAAESAAGLTDGAFLKGGEFTDFEFDTAITATTASTQVQVTVGAHELQRIEPSKEAAIIVEACFFMNAPAPDSDDIHLPYPVESGQSTQ